MDEMNLLEILYHMRELRLDIEHILWWGDDVEEAFGLMLLYDELHYILYGRTFYT